MKSCLYSIVTIDYQEDLMRRVYTLIKTWKPMTSILLLFIGISCKRFWTVIHFTTHFISFSLHVWSRIDPSIVLFVIDNLSKFPDEFMNFELQNFIALCPIKRFVGHHHIFTYPPSRVMVIPEWNLDPNSVSIFIRVQLNKNTNIGLFIHTFTLSMGLHYIIWKRYNYYWLSLARNSVKFSLHQLSGCRIWADNREFLKRFLIKFSSFPSSILTILFRKLFHSQGAL